MKKIYIFLPLFLTLFFFSLSNVKADEYTYTISDNVISFITSDLTLCYYYLANGLDLESFSKRKISACSKNTFFK